MGGSGSSASPAPTARSRTSQHGGRDARPEPRRASGGRTSSASSSRPIRWRRPTELARYVPRVLAVAEPADRGPRRGRSVAASGRRAHRRDAPDLSSSAPVPTVAISPARCRRSPAGRAGERDRGRLGRRPAGRRDERVRRQADHDVPVHRRTGIVTVRPNVVTAVPADSAGTVETVTPPASSTRRRGQGRRSISEAGAAAPIEEARIIVAGGRGVGGPDGFELVEELAEALGGAVGATRAAVDSGWIGYGQQIGQTGKIVKPAALPRARDQRRDPAQGRACRRPRRSSRSIATRTRRSPSSPISSSSATCSRWAGAARRAPRALGLSAGTGVTDGLAVVLLRSWASSRWPPGDRRLPRARPVVAADPRGRALPCRSRTSRPGRAVARREPRADRCRATRQARRRTIGEDVDGATEASRSTPTRPVLSRRRPTAGGSATISWPSSSGRGGRSGWSSTARTSWRRRGGRPRDRGARPSIKRGYLNLIHAREAIARHAVRAATLDPADRSSRSGAARARARRGPAHLATPCSGILGTPQPLWCEHQRRCAAPCGERETRSSTRATSTIGDHPPPPGVRRLRAGSRPTSASRRPGCRRQARRRRARNSIARSSPRACARR